MDLGSIGKIAGTVIGGPLVGGTVGGAIGEAAEGMLGGGDAAAFDEALKNGIAQMSTPLLMNLLNQTKEAMQENEQ